MHRKEEEYNIEKIAIGMKNAQEITIEKYYNKETGSIKEGETENLTNLEGIIVSVDEYSEYKFLIGESREIIGVLKGEITDTTKKEDFVRIEEFENKVKVIDNIEFTYEKKTIEVNKKQLLITIKDEVNGLNKIEYPDGDILNCNGKKEVGIDYTIECEVEYIFKITSNNGYVKEVTIYEEKADRWNLGIENKEFETYKGTAVYNGEKEGLYLEEAVISSKEPYTLNKEYTILIEVKDVICKKGNSFIVGMGSAGSEVGSRVLGMGVNSSKKVYMAYSGASDATSFNCGNWFEDGQWHILAIKYDGANFSAFVDGEKKGTRGASRLKNSKLYIGGISNSGTTNAGVYWGYASGYFRNLTIYSEALTDERIENYSFQ